MMEPPKTQFLIVGGQKKRQEMPPKRQVINAFVFQEPLPECACDTCEKLRKACDAVVSAYNKQATAHAETLGQLDAERDRAGALEERVTEVAVLMAGLIHDLRNMLTAPIGALAILKGLVGDKDSVPKLMQMLENGHARLLDTINLALDWFQAEAGKIPVRAKCIDIGIEAATLAKMMGQAATAKNITLEIIMQERVYANVDVRLFHHVLANLIDNAIKYTNDGGNVTLSAAVEDGRAVIRVSDTGPGIAGDDLPYIFDAYERGSASQGTKDGRGLGLAVVKKFIELMDGTIEVKSKVGAGSTFSVFFPAAKE